METMNVRKRNVAQKFEEALDSSNNSVKIVTNLDIFPKLPSDLQRQTTSGAAVTFIAFILIIILVVSEVIYYSNTYLDFDYEVDSDFTSQVPINIDMVVAMPCSTIGADVLDVTGQNTLLFGQLHEEDVVFELTAEEQQYWEMYQHVNTYMKDEYHAIHELLWRSDYTPQQHVLKRSKAVGKTDACRLHGSLHVNKLAGNFHVTAGRTFPHPAGHAHISAFLSQEDYNFTHRIIQFSFGDKVAGRVNPLDGEDKVAHENLYMYQYVIKVVPTLVSRAWSRTINTHQYSVTEQERSINHANNSHGLPGIYMKYDFFPFQVNVRERHYPIWQFLIRLCGIIGGVFVTLGIINSLLGCVMDTVFGKATASTIKEKFCAAGSGREVTTPGYSNVVPVSHLTIVPPPLLSQLPTPPPLLSQLPTPPPPLSQLPTPPPPLSQLPAAPPLSQLPTPPPPLSQLPPSPPSQGPIPPRLSQLPTPLSHLPPPPPSQGPIPPPLSQLPTPLPPLSQLPAAPPLSQLPTPPPPQEPLPPPGPPYPTTTYAPYSQPPAPTTNFPPHVEPSVEQNNVEFLPHSE